MCLSGQFHEWQIFIERDHNKSQDNHWSTAVAYQKISKINDTSKIVRTKDSSPLLYQHLYVKVYHLCEVK